jgi:hypothetical protein
MRVLISLLTIIPKLDVIVFLNVMNSITSENKGFDLMTYLNSLWRPNIY